MAYSPSSDRTSRRNYQVDGRPLGLASWPDLTGRVIDEITVVESVVHGQDLTQVELARRVGTTQSAIARIENGGTRQTLETLERVVGAGGKELAVVVGTRLIEKRSIARMVRSSHAVVRKAI